MYVPLAPAQATSIPRLRGLYKFQIAVTVSVLFNGLIHLRCRCQLSFIEGLIIYCSSLSSGFDDFVNMNLEDVTEYESTPEGRRVTKLDQILLNGNNITMVSARGGKYNVHTGFAN